MILYLDSNFKIVEQDKAVFAIAVGGDGLPVFVDIASPSTQLSSKENEGEAQAEPAVLSPTEPDTKAAAQKEGKFITNEDGRVVFIGGPGSGGGGASGQSASPAQQWVDSLTIEEKQALNAWGRSGREFRKLQTGDTESLSEVDKAYAEKMLPHWESALEKGIVYEGTTYRGLADVNQDVIDSWISSGGIQINCDQSSTFNKQNADRFTGNVLWVVDQRSGIGLFEQTNVTYGGSRVSENEVVLRKGTQYRVTGVQFVKRDGRVFDSADFFEGTDYSWPGNPPPGWSPSRDFVGHYEFSLVEQ